MEQTRGETVQEIGHRRNAYENPAPLIAAKAPHRAVALECRRHGKQTGHKVETRYAVGNILNYRIHSNF